MAKTKTKGKFDIKQLLVQKGERIGLGVAGAVCVLMILPLFWFLFFGESSRALVEDLTSSSTALKTKQASSVPSEADNPPKNSPTNAVVLVRPKVDKSQYAFAQLFMLPAQEDSTKRQLVHVLSPVEGRVDIALAQVKCYVLERNGDREKIMKLTGGASNGGGPGSSSNYEQAQRMYSQGRGNQSGGKSMSPPGGGGDRGRSPYGPPNQSQFGAQNNKPDLNEEWIPVSEMANLNGTTERLADKVEPLRMAIISASFPYHKQIQEFQDRLHLASERLVVDETVADKQDPSKTKHTFSFLSPLVERRTVDVHGNPLEEWKPTNLGERYLDLLYVNGQRFEDESPELEPVCFDGLVMPKMATMRKGEYPDGEKYLSELQKTLNTLAKEAKKGELVKPNSNPLSTSSFDPYSRPRPTETNNKTMRGPGGAFGPNPTLPPKGGVGPRGKPDGDPNSTTAVIPEYCLIRLIDVTIEPGKFYQYRIKVRMANPNLGMTNVASPTYATDETPLESADWFEIRPKTNTRPQLAIIPLVGGEVLSLVAKQNSERPQVVAVPPEYHLYTVDQQEIDRAEGKQYRGQNANATKDRQVALQIHKWVEYTDENPSVPSLAIGEWSVAERVLAYRGEYIGRRQRVEVPYWRSRREMFVLAVEPGRNKKPGLELDFGPRIPEGTPSDPPYYPILVDFDGGSMTHTRVVGKGKDGKDEVVRVDDRTGLETLILSPDGKLLAEHSWTDKVDKDRVERLNEWRKRIEDVKNPKDTGSATPGTDPFRKPPPGP